MRNLSSGAITALAARGGQPVILVTVTYRANQGTGTIVKRYATQSIDGDGDYSYEFASNEYRADIRQISFLSQSITPRGGLAPIKSGTFSLVNVDENGAHLSTIFDSINPERLEIAFDLVMHVGGVASGDEIRLADGIGRTVRITETSLDIGWETSMFFRSRPVPFKQVTLQEYPFAGFDNAGKPFPALFGDLRRNIELSGSTVFDPRGSGDSMIPLPMTQITGAFKWAAPTLPTAGAQQFMIDVNGYPIIPAAFSTVDKDDGDVSASSVYGNTNLRTDEDDLEDSCVYLSGFVDEAASTGVTNIKRATSRDLAQFATVEAGDVLIIRFQSGAPIIGHQVSRHRPAAGKVDTDVVVRFVVKDVTAGDTDPGKYEIEYFKHSNVTWTDIVASIAIDEDTIATIIQAIGDIGTFFTSSDARNDPWTNGKDLRVMIEQNAGDGIQVYGAQVIFATELTVDGLLNSGVKGYIAQVGFEEQAAAIDDYNNGSHVRGIQMTLAAGNLIANPADIIEILMREKNFGMNRPAAVTAGESLTDVTDIVDTINDADTTFDVTATEGSNGTVGRLYIIGDSLTTAVTGGEAGFEVMRLESISTDTWTVTRGMAGSQATAHLANSSIYELGETGGEINVGSFRAIAGWLRHEGAELISNGAMQGTFASGVAEDWTGADPSGNVTFLATGAVKYGSNAQKIRSDQNNGAGASLSQTITTTNGKWYRLSFWRAQITGATALLSVTIDQTKDITQTYVTTTTYVYTELVFQADTGSTTIAFNNVGDDASEMVFDEVRCVELNEWKWAFGMTERLEGRQWLQKLLPESLVSVYEDDNGRAKAVMLNPSASVQTFDADTIQATESPITQKPTGTTLSLNRSWDNVLCSIDVSFRNNPRAGLKEAIVFVHADYVDERATVASTSVDTTWLEVTINESVATTIDDVVRTAVVAAEAVSSDSVAKTITPTTNPAGAIKGDWIVLTDDAPGSGTTWIFSVVSLAGGVLTVADQPPDWSATSLTWTVVSRLHAFGGMIAAVLDSTSSTVLRVISGVIGTPTDLATPDNDPVWKLESDSEDGQGNRDQIHVAYNNRELEMLQRLVQTGQVLHETIEDERIHDYPTAIDLRNRVLDQAGPAWDGQLSTDLSTLKVEPGDRISIANSASLAHVVGSPISAHVLDWEIEPSTVRLQYGWHQFFDRRGKQIQDLLR